MKDLRLRKLPVKDLKLYQQIELSQGLASLGETNPPALPINRVTDSWLVFDGLHVIGYLSASTYNMAGINTEQVSDKMATITEVTVNFWGQPNTLAKSFGPKLVLGWLVLLEDVDTYLVRIFKTNDAALRLVEFLGFDKPEWGNWLEHFEPEVAYRVLPRQNLLARYEQLKDRM